MTKRETFVTTLGVLAASYDRKLTPLAMEGYWLALGDLSDQDLALATKRALQTCKFMPAPAELLTIARPPRDPVADAAEAWEAVRAAMDRYDYLRSVDFGPLVNAVVRNIGGWQYLCDQSLPDLVWRRKDFERVYEAFASKPPETLHGDWLEGWLHEPPIRIAIGGKLPLLQLEAPSNGVPQLIRDLAGAKAVK